MRHLLALLLCLALPLTASAWEAETIRVVDGDTVVVRKTEDGEQIRIRLYGIDAPEMAGPEGKSQRYSQSAKVFLENLLPRGSKVEVKDVEIDRHKRTVAVINSADDKVVQEEMIRAGMAWVYPEDCKLKEICDPLRELEHAAMKQKVGLWADKEPTPPWEWRKSKERAR